jgi:hypothetical protein
MIELHPATLAKIHLLSPGNLRPADAAIVDG